MANTYYMKRHDLLPSITATLKDSAGTAVSLTGYTVKFHMWIEGQTAKVNAAAVVVTPASGTVRYDWTGTDTDTAGEYACEWEATETSTSKTVTFPNYENDVVIILEDGA